MKSTYILQYDSNNQRWSALSREKSKEYPMHCGESFVICLGQIKLKCRLEMDSDWYIICNNNKRFALHPKEKYEINIP